MITPRDYQAHAVDQTMRLFAQHKRLLGVAATGMGKTILFAMICKQFHGRALVLAHRRELVDQAAAKIEMATGIRPDIDMADQVAPHDIMHRSRIVVGTVQTLTRGRMRNYRPQDFSLLVLDEGHHSVAQSWRRVVDYFTDANPDLRILGVTATPDRHDQAAMGSVYDYVAFDYDLLYGIRHGWLVPIKQRAVHIDGLDYSSVRTQHGDLHGRELAEVLEYEANMLAICDATRRVVGSRRALVFGVRIEHAERMAEILNRYTPGCARCIHSKIPREERDEIVTAYRNGEFQYLTNVGVATEGFDVPGIEVVVMARPTKSRGLYTQMAGRGTRALPGVVDGCPSPADRRKAIAASGKPSIEILDFVGNAGRHKLITACDLLGGNDPKIIEAAVSRAVDADEAIDVDDLVAEVTAEQLAAAEEARLREAARRANLKATAKFSTEIINAFDSLDLPEKTDDLLFHDEPASKNQITYLVNRFRVPAKDLDGISRRHASVLIRELHRRKARKLCTYKQAALLQRFGYDTKNMRFQTASELIADLKRHNWKLPYQRHGA